MNAKPATRAPAKRAPANAKRAPGKRAPAQPAMSKVLTIDIGGSSIKILASGETEPREVSSGREMSPTQMVAEVRKLAGDWKFTAVSLGYPGLVSVSGPVAEPGNLGAGWVGFDFAAAFGCPVRIVNDATLQALGSYDGGRMLFLGFGTGVGSVLIISHCVVPLELGELKWKGKTFSKHFGRDALDKHGEERWRERLLETIPSLQRAFLADYVVIGGGNSKYLLEPLPPNVRIGHNLTAFRGGYRLWGIDEMPTWHGEHRSGVQSLGDWRLL